MTRQALVLSQVFSGMAIPRGRFIANSDNALTGKPCKTWGFGFVREIPPPVKQKRPPRPFLTRAACLFWDARWDSESTSECAVRAWQARTLNQCPFYRSENAPGPRRRDLDAARGMNLRTLRCKESVSPPSCTKYDKQTLFNQAKIGFKQPRRSKAGFSNRQALRGKEGR